jgi:hypothetical protein
MVVLWEVHVALVPVLVDDRVDLSRLRVHDDDDRAGATPEGDPLNLAVPLPDRQRPHLHHRPARLNTRGDRARLALHVPRATTR